MVRRVRCPRCLAIIMANGDDVTCRACGLAGRVEDKAAAVRPAHGRATKKPRKRAKTTTRPAADRDPWTITIDLRKLAPSRWSPGAKAFSTLVMLAVVFVAGGVSGVVFERARNEVADDLDAGLFGASRKDATGDGGALDPGLGGTPGGDPGLTDGNASDPTAPPTGTSGPSTGTSGPTSGPTSTTSPPPDPPADGESKLSASAHGAWTSQPIQLDASLLRFTITHNGDGYANVKLTKDGQSAPAVTLNAKDAGSFTGVVRYGGIQAAGSYTVAVYGPSLGQWELDIDVVGDDSAAAPGTREGYATAGLGPFSFDGDMEVGFTTFSSHAFDVKAYTQTGAPVSGCSLQGTGATTKQGACSFTAPTKVYFDISIPRHEQEWQLRMAAAA